METQKTAAFQKTQIVIGSFTADVFKCQASGHLFYSLTSVAALIGKQPLSAFQFLASKAFKAKHGKDYIPFQFSDRGDREYKLLDCKVASAYLMHWAKKGDPLAEIIVEALLEESLELRAAKAFGATESTKEAIRWKTNQGISKTIQELNETRKGIGEAFNRKFAGGKIHDRLTLLVFGQTARDAIVTNGLIGECPTVGLDHQDDPELMEILIDCKTEALRYRSGTHAEMIDRAYKTVMERRSKRTES